MTTRRDNADRLAALLDADPDDARAGSAEDLQLTALATMLRDAPIEVPPMRPEFRDDLRIRVLRAARTTDGHGSLFIRLRDAGQRFKYSAGLAAATGLASVALTGGGLARAAEFAQPGDLLYGTKLVLEDVQLWLTGEDVDRGLRNLTYVQDRLAEAVAAAGRGDAAAVAMALDLAAAGNREASALILRDGQAQDLRDLADALDAQEALLDGLRPQLTGAAAAAAAGLAAEIDAARVDLGRLVPNLSPPPALPPPALPALPAPTSPISPALPALPSPSLPTLPSPSLPTLPSPSLPTGPEVPPNPDAVIDPPDASAPVPPAVQPAPVEPAPVPAPVPNPPLPQPEVPPIAPVLPPVTQPVIPPTTVPDPSALVPVDPSDSVVPTIENLPEVPNEVEEPLNNAESGLPAADDILDDADSVVDDQLPAGALDSTPQVNDGILGDS